MARSHGSYKTSLLLISAVFVPAAVIVDAADYLYTVRLAASGLTSAVTAFADLSSAYADVAANSSSADRINALIIGCEKEVNSRSAYQIFAIPKTKPLDCFPIFWKLSACLN